MALYPVRPSWQIHHFAIRLADVDRAVYASLSLKLARHPSETAEFLVARVLAYCLEYTEGIAFSAGGLSQPDQPAIAVNDLTGARLCWIEVGSPDAARVHKAAKAAPRVVIYTHKAPELLLKQLAGERIHRSDALELYAIDPALVGELAARLERRMALDLSVTERSLFITTAGSTLAGEVRRLFLR